MARELTSMPASQLACRRDWRGADTLLHDRYVTSPLPSRPDTGRRISEVSCGYCTRKLHVEILSIPATVRLRRCWLVAGVAGLLVTALAIAGIVSRVPIGLSDQHLTILGIVLAVLGFILAVLGAAGNLTEDGVLLLSYEPGGKHELL